MPNYRLYRLDGAGKIMSAEWLEAADDEDAGRKARELSRDATAEVWDRNRMVVRVEPPRG